MARRESWQLAGGFWLTSLGTLASRVLGLARDMATAALLGLGEGGIMDAFVVAFRIPNLFRRIFGEGALAASFLPIFASEYANEPRRAWQLLTALFVRLAALLAAIVLVGEVVLLSWLWMAGGPAPLVGLLAAMLPYLIFVCLAAQASAALQARLAFRLPALAPLLLNVCWLAAVWFVAPVFASDKMAQAYVIAVAVVVSGALQFVVQWPALRRLGFRFDYDWSASREAFGQIVRAMAPITLGLAVTQLNTVADSLIAWGLSDDAGATRTIAWLPGAVPYPMQTGAAAAIYYGERFYQLPVGLLGAAIATVIYPLLAGHAARADRDSVGRDLTLGLRLVLFAALPASVGLILVAEPMTHVLFERGEFTSADAARAARIIACYAAGVWAYCAIPVLVRGFYALGNRIAPARLGLVAVGTNLALNLVLVWPLAELGLATSTVIAAALQVVLLATTFSQSASRLAWRALGATVVKSALAALAMGVAVVAVGHWFPVDAGDSRGRMAAQLVLAIAAGAIVYLAAARLLAMEELGMLLARSRPRGDVSADDE